ADVTSWMYKFMSDAFIDGSSDKVRFEIQTTPLKEHNENGGPEAEEHARPPLNQGLQPQDRSRDRPRTGIKARAVAVPRQASGSLSASRSSHRSIRPR